jgi:hypothetical protein
MRTSSRHMSSRTIHLGKQIIALLVRKRRRRRRGQMTFSILMYCYWYVLPSANFFFELQVSFHDSMGKSKWGFNNFFTTVQRSQDMLLVSSCFSRKENDQVFNTVAASFRNWTASVVQRSYYFGDTILLLFGANDWISVYTLWSFTVPTTLIQQTFNWTHK